MDYSTKLFKYRSAGVREYWLVDPDKNRIMVWNFEHEDAGDYTFSDSVKAGIYDDLSIDFLQLKTQDSHTDQRKSPADAGLFLCPVICKNFYFLYSVSPFPDIYCASFLEPNVIVSVLSTYCPLSAR